MKFMIKYDMLGGGVIALLKKKMIVDIITRRKLESGPAAAVSAISLSGLRNFSTIIGTGLAPPKINLP